MVLPEKAGVRFRNLPLSRCKPLPLGLRGGPQGRPRVSWSLLTAGLLGRNVYRTNRRIFVCVVMQSCCTFAKLMLDVIGMSLPLTATKLA